MAQQEDNLKKIISHCKEYGFVYPSSEIYDGLSAAYDYGPNGVELKQNIRKYWWMAMVQLHSNIVGIDASIFMHPSTWKASGHVDAFNDPMIDNKDSKKRYRADQLVENHCEKIQKKIDKEVTKAAKRFGDSFDEAQFRATNGRVVGYQEQIDSILDRMNTALTEEKLDDLKALIEELQIADPESGSRNWTEVRQFNLMFSTEMGSLAGEANKIYLRPETAQGIFVNFNNVLKTSRQKVPFGIAQIGKAFRNEIVARQFIFRMREFEQMEMQFFVKPGTEQDSYEYWKEQRINWHKSLGIPADQYRFHDHAKLAHYAKAACDIEFNFPMGFRELEGIHSRGDFDLKAHEEHSGKKLQYFDHEEEQSYVPNVIETSIGLDRMFLALLSNAYEEETLSDNTSRKLLRLPAFLAPVQVAVFPLENQDGMPELATKIFDELKFDFKCDYEAKDRIGRRYRRQDAIGTPYCITIDRETLEDGQVTIRERDTMDQERIPIEKLREILTEKTSMKRALLKA